MFALGAYLAAAHEELETLGESGPCPVVFGEGGHDLWVVGDEGRVNELILQEVSHLLMKGISKFNNIK